MLDAYFKLILIACTREAGPLGGGIGIPPLRIYGIEIFRFGMHTTD